MARSHKPVVWLLFAGGGTFAAFVMPVLIFITGLAISFDLLPAESLAYERVLSMAQNPVGKGLLFIVVFLPAWHAAHRLRITAHDFGVRADAVVMTICYGLAALATLISVYAIFSI